MQVDGQAFWSVRVGRQDNTVYKAANDLRRFATAVIAVSRAA